MLRVLTLSTLYPDQNRPTFGGFVERQTQALAARGGVEVVVASGVGVPPWPLSLHPHFAGRRRAESGWWNGVEIVRLPFRTLPGLPAGAGKALARAMLPQLKTLRERFSFDVIDAEFFWPDGVAAMHLSRALGVPFSVKARGSDIHHWGGVPAVRGQMVEAAREAGGLLAVSGAMKRHMEALGMSGEKIRVHYTGVDLERFRPVDRAAAKAALGVRGPLLVSAGALIPLKGQALVIEALHALPEATLILVGDGPERARLEAVAAPLGKRVRFLGNRPHGELPGLLAAADVMVLPSEREGLANVWVEALACGTPVVITDVGGAREVVDRPEAGRLVARSAEGIAEGVRAVLATPSSPEAARAAAERFSWQRNAAELQAHLERVAKS
ncbi:MAG TPA: glycosyltransferase [Allosphingosinicella sp.]|jgi:glycosyltransferase involved in cell wall biosynthesis